MNNHSSPDSALEPCPFCGERLVLSGDYTHETAWNFWCHSDPDGGCILADHRILAEMDMRTPSAGEAAKWNWRAPVKSDPAQGAHMTVASTETAFDEWCKTLTVVDRPSNQEIFSQGYVAGWNAKEAAPPQAARDPAEVLMDLDDAEGSLDTCRWYSKQLEQQVREFRGAMQEIILRTSDPMAAKIATTSLSRPERGEQ